MNVENAYTVLFTVILVLLSLMILFCLIRAIKGPKIGDRIVAINCIGTVTNIAIAVLATMLKESYLADICLIYAIVSFVSVIVLTRAYIAVHTERQSKKGSESK